MTRATPVRPAFSWFFRDRRTGKIVIMQRPNIPLMVWILATVLGWFVHNNIVMVVGTVALVVWAVDEVVRGVNPWRRCLGGAVLAMLVVRAVMGA